jgi:iron complex transport system ATP-binding protein
VTISTNGTGSHPETGSPPHAAVLEAQRVSLSYDDVPVTTDLSVAIPPGKITCIVGANACGKSTLLRALARLLKPRSGTVILDGESIQKLSTKVVATKLGILPQSPIAPDGITVADLVSRGRYPHQGWFRQWTDTDEVAITEAMRVTGILPIATRPVDELSGGQRQRVWIAMALAQGTGLMLLDEPTTYLDLAHQVDVLDLLVDLNLRERRTIVLVLHDLNHAARYSHHLVALKAGAVAASGSPTEVITAQTVEDVFGLRVKVIRDPVAGTPMVVPVGRHLSVGSDGPDEACRPQAPNGRAWAADELVVRGLPPEVVGALRHNADCFGVPVEEYVRRRLEGEVGLTDPARGAAPADRKG